MKIDINNFLSSASGRRVCRVITKGRTKPAQVVQMVLEAVQEILPALSPHVAYSTEDLCGPELWINWKTGERRSAGMCMTYLTENDHLPLERASVEGEYPLKFRLKALPCNAVDAELQQPMAVSP